MKDLSEHITDIAQNSTRAEASLIEIGLKQMNSQLSLFIKDNGSGMTEEMIETVSDPFTTTRTTRKVGMGLPFLRQSAEQTEGSFQIQSVLGAGTEVQAVFNTEHWDMLPLGNVPETIVLLVGGNPDIDFVFRYQKENSEEFVFDTREVKEMLEGLPLSDLSVMKMLKELIQNNMD